MLHIYVTKSDKYIMYYVYIIYILIYYNSCRPETRTYNLWILKNISTRVPYIKIYYFIYHIISSNIFTYIPIVTYCINISLSGVVRLLLMWPAPKGFIKDHASFISHSHSVSYIHSTRVLWKSVWIVVNHWIGYKWFFQKWWFIQE